MTVPICPSCKSDKYLQYTEFEPATSQEVRLPVSGGATRTRNIDPVVRFFCRKCGYFNGYTVDTDWTPPERDTVSIDELRALGSYWVGPDKKVTVREDGGTVTTFGT
jgi:hypothetical protein